MSKIGHKPIIVPSDVTIELVGTDVVVRGPKGQLTQALPTLVSFAITDGTLLVSRKNDSRQARANHGLARSLIQNMVAGVTAGYTRRLELIGTGYRVAMKGAGLTLTVGFSHPVHVEPVAGITFGVEGNTIITVQGIDKHEVGQVAANIRKIRPPEPYKGKGIRYQDEQVRRKQGKTAVK